MLELYARDPLADGRLIQVLPDWAEETYPIYAYHHSARLQSAKVRAFMEFVIASTREPFPGGAAAANASFLLPSRGACE